MIESLPKGVNFINDEFKFAFYCPKKYKSNLDKYRGFNIYYSDLIIGDTIYLMQTDLIDFNDYG